MACAAAAASGVVMAGPSRAPAAPREAGGGHGARAIELGLQQRVCASSTSVLVATPAVKRSPTTRCASVRGSDAVVGRGDRGAAESSSSRRCSHLERHLAIEIAPRGSARAPMPRPRPARRRWRPPSQSDQLTLTETSQESSTRPRAGRCAGWAGRSRSRRRSRPAAWRRAAAASSRSRAASMRLAMRAPLGALRVRDARATQTTVAGTAGSAGTRARLDVAPAVVADQPAQIRLGDLPLVCAPRSPAAAGATLRLGGEHLVRRDQPLVEAAAEVAHVGVERVERRAARRCSVSRAVTSAQNARVISSRRIQPAPPQVVAGRVPLRAGGRAERVDARPPV